MACLTPGGLVGKDSNKCAKIQSLLVALVAMPGAPSSVLAPRLEAIAIKNARSKVQKHPLYKSGSSKVNLAKSIYLFLLNSLLSVLFFLQILRFCLCLSLLSPLGWRLSLVGGHLLKNYGRYMSLWLAAVVHCDQTSVTSEKNSRVSMGILVFLRAEQPNSKKSNIGSKEATSNKGHRY